MQVLMIYKRYCQQAKLVNYFKHAMKVLIYIIILIFFSCNSHEKNVFQETFENADSIAFSKIENTIHFWEFSKFILKYPNSKYFYIALNKYNEVRDKYYDSIAMPVVECFNNCAAIQIKANQQIVYEHKLIKMRDLKDSLFDFFCNKNNENNKPERMYVCDVYGNTREIFKGHIEISYVNDSCDILQNVVKGIHNSLISYKNYLSMNWYKKQYSELSQFEKQNMDLLFENILIFYSWNKEYTIQPPPPIK